jgi:hypothetical protein
VIVRFVDIGGIVDHHCLEVIVRFVDIGGIVALKLIDVMSDAVCAKIRVCIYV